ncbi:MAG TPA: flavodoxin family protein [Candidatus Limnocylindria bacterium]
MKSLVVYVSHKGNTQRVAEAIGDVLAAHGTVDVLPVEEAPPIMEEDIDLLMIGGPTEGHGMTPEMSGFLDRLDVASVRGRAVAAFDTRVNWPRILSGSAADGIGKRLEAAGAMVFKPQGSFIVSTEPVLLPGELERAREWAESVARSVVPVPA